MELKEQYRKAHWHVQNKHFPVLLISMIVAWFFFNYIQVYRVPHELKFILLLYIPIWILIIIDARLNSKYRELLAQDEPPYEQLDKILKAKYRNYWIEALYFTSTVIAARVLAQLEIITPK